MKKEIVIMLKDRTVVKTYFDTRTPKIGDSILTSDEHEFLVIESLMNKEEKKLCLICEMQ